MKQNVICPPVMAVMLLLSLCMNVVAQPWPGTQHDGKARSTHNSDPGYVMTKQVNEDGNLLTLESYVTGIVTVPTPKPVDFVLLLDASSSMINNQISYYNYTARKSASYSYSGYGSTSYYYLLDGKYYQVNRFKAYNVNKYWLYFVANGVRYYLKGTAHIQAQSNANPTSSNYPKDLQGVAIEPTTNTSTTIWTGVLYTRSSATMTRLQALKNAVCSFIDAVKTESESTGVQYRISIVKYSTQKYSNSGTNNNGSPNINEGNNAKYTEVVKNYTKVDATSATTLKDKVNAIQSGSGTYVNCGMELVQLLNSATTNPTYYNADNEHVLIMFTDGEPEGVGSTIFGSGTNLPVNIAINLAHKQKENKVTVYSIGVFGTATPSQNIQTYMNAFSSNYPNAVSFTNTGTKVSDDYFFNATNSEELSQAFATIAEVSCWPRIDLNEETVVRDVISQYFNLPEGADADDIHVYTADCTGQDMEGNYEFGERVAYDATVNVGVLDNLPVIEVSNFDFSDNHIDLGAGEDPHGKKLIIEIPIEPRPGYAGILPTNAPGSTIISPEGYFLPDFEVPHHEIEKSETWVGHICKPELVDDDDISVSGGTATIKTAEGLAWFVSLVGGYNGQEAQPELNGNLVADIDMSGYSWVPIGGYVRCCNPDNYAAAAEAGEEYVYELPQSHAYSGTFDGGGHAITGLWNDACAVQQPGLFGTVDGGTIRNTFVMDCDFRAIAGNKKEDAYTTDVEGYFGILADTLRNGSLLYNCEAAGLLQTYPESSTFATPVEGIPMPQNPLKCYLGGLVGLVDNSVVHSCISVADLKGYSMGGMVNEIRAGVREGALRNGMSFPTFFTWDPSVDTDLGGLVALNKGDVQNCYVRERDKDVEENEYGICAELYRLANHVGGSGKLVGEANRGLLIGNNSGSTAYCYVPLVWFIDRDYRKLVGKGNEATGIGTYTATETPYMYMHDDNSVSSITETGANGHIVSTFPGMLQTLNHWVDNPADGDATPYTRWFRTTADGINNDYPVLKIMDFNTVGSDDNIRLYYGDIDAMMGGTSMYTPDIEGDTYCIYQNTEVETGNNGATLYINEDVAITQTEELKAFVGITLDNTAHDAGGGASQGNPNDYDYGANTRDWHMFATSLSDAPLGVEYTDSDQHAFHYDPTPEQLPQYSFYPEDEYDGYFPSHTYDKTEGIDPNYHYYKDWDYYCWSEPDNHWINFKRNSYSHWVETKPTVNLCYTNETTLVPGKGYLLAIAEETFLQSHGMLNRGDVSIGLSNSEGNEMSRGFNFIGNPYQSYLDFDAFAEENGIDSYTILDEDAGGYVTYAATGSMNSRSASQHISMHQGFLIYTDGSVSEVTFTEAMRGIEANEGEDVSFRGGEKASYTLVNLILTESDGKREIVTVETGRPEAGGARKMMGLVNGKSQLYAHYDGENYSVLFATGEMHTIPVRFHTYEDDTFTLTWDIENGSLGELYLVDNITGQTVDMLTQGEYKFEGRTTDFSSRFKLVFGNGGDDEPAEGEDIEDIFAYQNDGNLTVAGEGRLEMYDMSGRLVECVSLYGDLNTVVLPKVTRGVYTLRLTNSTDSKVQKIVIR